MNRGALVCGALLGGLAVGLGAFGTHALEETLAPRQLGWWQTAVQYQMWHALALLAVAAMPGHRWAAVAALFASGTILFAGSLYLMALTGLRWLGMVTPIGGGLLIAGWALLAWGAVRRNRAPFTGP